MVRKAVAGIVYMYRGCVENDQNMLEWCSDYLHYIAKVNREAIKKLLWDSVLTFKFQGEKGGKVIFTQNVLGNQIFFQKCPYFGKEGRWENKIKNVPN